MAEHFEQHRLAEIVLKLAPVNSESLAFSPVRTGKHNSSYWVESNLGRFVLRIAPPDDAGFLFYERLMMRQEPALHGFIRANTTIPVAEVVGYDFSRNMIDRDYLLLTALPGAPLSEMMGLGQSQRDRALFQVGGHLRQLHALFADAHLGGRRYGYLGEHAPMRPAATWADAFTSMWSLLLDDVAACGAYTDAEAGALREALAQHLHHFDRPVTPSLLHMDVWAQNILVDAAGNVTGLVDFDRALWGDLEIEFAVLDYCGISEPAFWDGYGRQRDESESAKIRQRFYLLYELQKYMPISVWRRHDLTAAARYREQSLRLAMPLFG